MAKILLVEDDQQLASQLVDTLSREHHIVEHACDGTTAEELLNFTTFDIIILDWNMPGMSGVDVCRNYRSNRGKTPILMLTGRSDVPEREQGLDAGCDDYLTKPFATRELNARIRALLRREPIYLGSTMTVGSLTLDTNSRKVTFDGNLIELQPREFSLLEFLIKHPGESLSAEAILQRVWATDSTANIETVYTYITKLRKKVVSKEKSTPIKTVHRVGYRLDEDS